MKGDRLMLDVERISKTYRGIPALTDVSFSVSAGEIVGYLGPNGAGKSTTVKIIIGLLQPTSGRVLFRGERIDANLAHYRSQLGYLPEEAHLYTHLSGLEYLQLIGRLRGMAETTIYARAVRLLHQLGLDSWRHSPIGLYSKGMKQRVLIAAAILHDPPLLVLDEPLSGLDVLTARLFRDLLLELSARGKAVLYISHVLEVVEKVCGRVLILAGGRLRADAAPRELIASMGLTDLEAVFSQVVQQQDTRQTARDMAQGIADA